MPQPPARGNNLTAEGVPVVYWSVGFMQYKIITSGVRYEAFMIIAAFCFCPVAASLVRAQNPKEAALSAVGSSVANENYKIGPGDIIDITVSKNLELSRSGLRVSNKGTIQLAM